LAAKGSQDFRCFIGACLYASLNADSVLRIVAAVIIQNEMIVTKTAIPGVLIIEPKIFGDARGLFTEIYQTDRYATHGIGRQFVQDNLSRSGKGTLRGLHFQNPSPQGKLVTILRGSVLDAAVDIRRGSPTFGQHVMVELNDENRRQFWIPAGLAHGFIVQSDTADFFYKCDAFYSPSDEKVLLWNDPKLGINWNNDAPLLSARDKEGLTLAQLADHLPKFEPV
jgi:dTDP-4-dehydrorhamnose 3,5-epimerase